MRHSLAFLLLNFLVRYPCFPKDSGSGYPITDLDCLLGVKKSRSARLRPLEVVDLYLDVVI